MAAPLGLLAAAAPFAAGAVLPVDMASGDGAGSSICPFRNLTGLPCPLCGSTRAFTLLMHGDSAWTSYNVVVVVVVAVVLLWQLNRLVWGDRVRGPSGRWQLPAAAALLAVAWAWTLSHAETIAPG